MSKKTLNAANLSALGAERLADLMMEVSAGSAEIKRRLRLELSHNLGAEALAHDVRKRLASIRRATGYVSWRKRKALVRDLATQSQMITEKIAPDAPAEAFDLLWQFIQMAPQVNARTDDSRGEIAAVFEAALASFAQIGPNAGQEPTELAARIWDEICDNSFGEFDGIIALLAPTLGDLGLAQLKSLAVAHRAAPVAQNDDHAALQFLRDLRSTGGNFAQDQKDQLIRLTLQQIAAAQGDIEGYIAEFTDAELARPRIAAQVAALWLEQARPQDALDVLNASDGAEVTEWNAAYIATLTALERPEEAQTHRWTCFLETLDVQSLRDHLKALPDFDDVEAEDAARVHALQFDDVIAALQFFIDWPDLLGAAELVQTRAREIDGGVPDILSPAADALRDRHPLAAVLLWRTMIEDALWEGRTARYATAAHQIMDCAAAEADIEDYGRFAPHQTYLEQLRAAHQHKASFWARVP